MFYERLSMTLLSRQRTNKLPCENATKLMQYDWLDSIYSICCSPFEIKYSSIIYKKKIYIYKSLHFCVDVFGFFFHFLHRLTQSRQVTATKLSENVIFWSVHSLYDDCCWGTFNKFIMVFNLLSAVLQTRWIEWFRPRGAGVYKQTTNASILTDSVTNVVRINPKSKLTGKNGHQTTFVDTCTGGSKS